MYKWLENVVRVGWLLFGGNSGDVSRSWYWSHGFYVAHFKESLDDVARTLDTNVLNRFNLGRKCAELCDAFGVIARISVHGEMGLPDKAFVCSPLPLPDTTRELLAKALSPLKIEFTVGV